MADRYYEASNSLKSGLEQCVEWIKSYCPTNSELLSDVATLKRQVSAVDEFVEEYRASEDEDEKEKIIRHMAKLAEHSSQRYKKLVKKMQEVVV